MKTRLLILAALAGLSPAVHAGFIDTFNGTSLNTSLWDYALPYSDSSVVVTNGNLVLTNRGRVATDENFSSGVDVTMAFAFTGNQHDSFVLGSRTEIPPAGQFDTGVFASFRIRTDPIDPMGTANNVSLFSQSYPDGYSLLTTGTFTMSLNETYLIRYVDTGSLVSLYINDLSNPFLTAAAPGIYGDGDSVGFFNREGAGAGSHISAGAQVSIDFVSVANVPETGATALYLMLGAIALGMIRRRLAVSHT